MTSQILNAFEYSSKTDLRCLRALSEKNLVLLLMQCNISVENCENVGSTDYSGQAIQDGIWSELRDRNVENPEKYFSLCKTVHSYT